VKDFLFNGLSFLARFAGNSLVFFWLARLLDDDEFGRLSFLFLLANFALVLMDFGLYYLVVEAVMRGRGFRIAALLRVKYITSAAGFLLMALAGWVLFSLRGQVAEDYLPYFLLLLSTVMLALSQHYLYHFRVRNRFRIETISQTFYSAGILLGVAVLALSGSVSLWSVVGVFVFLRLVFLLISRRYFTSLHLSAHRWVGHWRHISVYLKRSSLYGMTALVGYALLLLDSTLMYVYFPEQLPMYQGGVRVVLMVMMLTEVLTVFFLPRLHGEQPARDGRLYLAFCVLLGVSICVPVWLFPDFVVQLLYGQALGDLVQYMRYFGAVAALRVALGYVGTMLTFHGHHRIRLRSLSMALVVLPLAALGLAPGSGVAGLLSAVILAHLVAFFYQLWWLRRIQGGNLSAGVSPA
jgi:O-antigen/teichoic acid export membrane protein